MEADWEVEIGPTAAVIEGSWAGFVDLVTTPGRVGEIVEARDLPALAGALLRLNGSGIVDDGRLILTSKCDVWSLADCDPDEFDSSEADATFGLACYIDLLPRNGLVFGELVEAENWARDRVGRLKGIAVPGCRIDLVIRRAFVGSLEGCGITAYIAGCGSNPMEARIALAAALDGFAETLSPNQPGL